MKRLRHPIRAIREPFGTAGLIVACVALIAALGGTALAAKGALTGKQKKEVEKIAKKFAGKPGAAGAQGPAGPQGPAGAAGKDGAPGAAGTAGPTGPTGPKGAAGPAGAVGTVGPTGATGPTGSFGGEPAPAGITMTGRWATSGSFQAVEVGEGETVNVGNPFAYASVSFPQEVVTDFPVQPHFQTEANFTDFNEGDPGEEGCKGDFEAPTAPQGNLCIYKSFLGYKELSYIGAGNPPIFPNAIDPDGFTMKFVVEGAEAVGIGSWALNPGPHSS